MNYNFDRVVERRGTASEKWDMCDSLFKGENLLPLWVADMDFPAPPEVIDALTARAKHGIFGYTGYTESSRAAVTRWFKTRHRWDIDMEWILFSPGVVPALSLLVQTMTSPGDGVIIQRPVYNPFMKMVEANGRKLLNSPLRQNSTGSYEMNFDDLRDKAADPGTKMMILCSPHNPVGRVWRRDELETLIDICSENDILIVSDEIHCDLVYREYRHLPLATVKPEYGRRIITCTAPSKTFNIAGLQLSNIIIPDETLRKSYRNALLRNAMFEPNSFAATAMEAAYNYGAPWLDELMEYIRGNLDLLTEVFSEELPEVNVIKPEGTFLVWTDFRKFGIDYRELLRIFVDEAKVAPGQGDLYGTEGEGFMRFNLACPRAILAEGLQRIVSAFKTK